MKPICVPCRRFMRPVRNGLPFVEQMPIENGALPGLAEPQKWQPYKLWIGDLWECPTCHAQIVSGVAFEPVAEHYHPDFADKVKALAGEKPLEVNDC